MLKTYLCIPDHLNEEIRLTAKLQKKSKAEVMRQALEKGIVAVKQQGNASVRALLKLAELGKKNKERGPRDLSANMDKHLWGIEKRDDE